MVDISLHASFLPPVAAVCKNFTVFVTETGALWRSDGTQWRSITVPDGTLWFSLAAELMQRSDGAWVPFAPKAR